MSEIIEWLNNEHRSYSAGLELLRKHKPASFAIRLCAARVSAFNLELMKKELLTVPGAVAPAIEQASPASDQQLADRMSRIMKDEFKRLNHLFMTSLRSSDHAEREDAAAQILKGFKEVIRPIQDDLKYFQKYKKLPERHYLTVSVSEEVSEVDIKQQILNLRSRISKNKNNPKRQSDVQKWIAQKNHLETLITK